MKYTQIVLITTLFIAGAAMAAEPTSWDIVNEVYGSGAGQVSFNSSFTYQWSSAPPEVLTDGHATLTLPVGSGVNYACRASLSGLPTNDADVTLEFKMRLVNKTKTNIYYSETPSMATSHWNHLLMINANKVGVAPDVLSDYNRNTYGENLAPAGFDGSEVHTYRVVRENGRSFFYLYDGGVAVLLDGLISIAGAAGDAQVITLGFAQDPSIAAQIELYSLKIANGSWTKYYDVLGTFAWDILDETYGNGAGQVLFNDSYLYPWTLPATETPSDGFSTLTIPTGTSYIGPVKNSISGMAVGDMDVTVEIKFRAVNNTPVNFCMSEQPINNVQNKWNHIWQVNQIFGMATSDSMADYNLRDGATNIAPASFDGSALHTYRMTRQNGATYLWLDDSAPVRLATLTNGTGSAIDSKALELSFVEHPAQDVVIEMYSLKIGHGANPKLPLACKDPQTVYLPRDYNQDCSVNFADFATFAADWLKCSDPANANCDQYWR